MAYADIYGPSVTTSMVEQAVIATAQDWLPSYVAVVSTASDEPTTTVQLPNTWQASYDFDDYTSASFPAFVVICAGTTGEIERLGNGDVGGWFSLDVGVLIEDQTEASTRQVASLYMTAVAMMLEQQADLGGIATQTLVSEVAVELPDEAKRTVAYGRVTAETYVEAIYNRDAGASTPTVVVGQPTTPPGTWPVVEGGTVTVTMSPESESETD